MSGGLRHHSDEATGPESCGWIKRHRKKYRYYLEQTSASALRGSYAPGLQKQSSMYLDSADVVSDVENRLSRVEYVIVRNDEVVGSIPTSSTNPFQPFSRAHDAHLSLEKRGLLYRY